MIVNLNHVQKNYNLFSLDCSLSMEEGRVTGLIGQNGAGKSTTFKAILGLISIDGGEIQIFGKNQSELQPADKEKIGVVLSESGFSGFLTVKDAAAILQTMYKRFDRENFLRKCREFALPADKQLKEFSTGMKAKLRLLAATSYEAQLLILDEPTAGLDVVARDELLDLLREYMEQPGRSILISSHISGDLEGLCDDLYMIHNGKIILHEETDVLIDRYGLLKVSEEEYRRLDPAYLLAVQKEPYGYCCLTGEKQFYMENYPGIVVERGSIDDVITILGKGKRI